ncbi:MAG: isocitrate lyase/phosphoenolpyruvate mutase family protein [Mycobacterium sp.]
MSFRDLHYADEPLLLPNAWDVSSALAFYDAGYRAVGTTSFGVAASAGHPDGGRASKEPTSRLARQLRNVPVYVSADVEDGYHDDPEVVAKYVSGLGVAGINIEDSTDEKLISPKAHAAKVAAIKKLSPEVFVNARADTYWLDQEANVSATLKRAEAYVEAGADGIFVPGVTDPADLLELTANIPLPVNVLVVPGLSLAELADLGVRRVSTGSLPYRAAIDAAVQVAQNVRNGVPPPAATAYPAMQARLVEFDRLNQPG